MKIALIEAGAPGLNVYSHVSMGRGVVLLATILKDLGHDVRCFVEDIAGRESIDRSFLSKAHVVGFSSITCTLPPTKDLLDKIRLINPEAVFVLGGPEPTCDPERSLRIGADFVIRGEGEKALPELLEAIEGKRSLTEIKGLSWKREGQIVHNEDRPQLTKQELNQLPITDCKLVAGAEKRTVGAVWRSRGCPGNCDFCEVRKIWRRYVIRDEEISVNELMELGQEMVFLVDDNCAAVKASLMRFLNLAIEKGFCRHIAVQLRADAALTKKGKIDRSFLRLLRRFACSTTVCVGVESANDKNLEEMGKRISVKRMKKALRAMSRYGMVIHGMLIALASDDIDTIRENGRFARRYLNTLQFLFEVPLPGTEKTKQHEAAGRILWEDFDDLAWYNGMHVVLKPDKMSPLEMQQAVFKEYEKFYSLPRFFVILVEGLLFRWRLLNPGQRRCLKELPLKKRFRRWLWYHIEWKFAPLSLRWIGRKRVEDFRKDFAYQKYLERLAEISKDKIERKLRWDH